METERMHTQALAATIKYLGSVAITDLWKNLKQHFNLLQFKGMIEELVGRGLIVKYDNRVTWNE